MTCLPVGGWTVLNQVDFLEERGICHLQTRNCRVHCCLASSLRAALQSSDCQSPQHMVTFCHTQAHVFLLVLSQENPDQHTHNTQPQQK
jgi:hypothetical protein